MTHEEIRDLLGAYVLEAVSAEEAHIVRQHLDTCAECAAEVTQLADAPHWLALSAGEMEPPPQLRIRLMNLVEHDRAEWLRGQAAVQDGARPPGRAGWWQALQQRLAGMPRRVYGLAGAVAVAAAIALVILLRRGPVTIETHTGSAVAAVVDGFSFQHVTALVVVRSDHTTEVSFTNLPQLPSRLAYELWFIPAKGNPAPITGFEANAQHGYSTRLQRDASAYSEAAVTIERAPGDSPTPNLKTLAIAVKLQG
jgi:anti-sigma-K factor RskA